MIIIKIFSCISIVLIFILIRRTFDHWTLLLKEKSFCQIFEIISINNNNNNFDRSVDNDKIIEIVVLLIDLKWDFDGIINCMWLKLKSRTVIWDEIGMNLWYIRIMYSRWEKKIIIIKQRNLKCANDSIYHTLDVPKLDFVKSFRHISYFWRCIIYHNLTFSLHHIILNMHWNNINTLNTLISPH